MNIKLISKALHTLSQLSDEDVAIVFGLRSASEDERGILMLALEPNSKPQKKSSKKAAGKATTREYDHCLRCGTTKRDSSHKDQSSPDYHEFQSSKDSDAAPAKSARASGIAKTLNNNLSQRRQGRMIPDVVEHDTEEPARCQFTRADGSTCGLLADHNIHHLITAREYHYFQSLAAPRCAFRVTDIERCSATEDDPIHDEDSNPATYHEFQPPASSATGASGD